jgi:hypothetical protein
MVMSIDFVPAVAAAVILPVSAVVGRRTWHGWMGVDPAAGARIWGPNHWRALIRAMPTGAVMMMLAAGLTLVLAYVPSSTRVGGIALRSTLAATLGAGTFISFMLAASVLLTNRPRRLVPPIHRGSPTLISDWVHPGT